MPPIGPALLLLIAFAALGVLFVAAVAHVLIGRYWATCALVTALVLLSCVGLHALEDYRDAPSIAMLYGIGGASGLAVSAAAGLQFVVARRIRDRATARRLADARALRRP